MFPRSRLAPKGSGDSPLTSPRARVFPANHLDFEFGLEALFGEPQKPPRRRGWKLVTLSHNLVRGAAGGSILNAELALATGLLAP